MYFLILILIFFSNVIEIHLVIGNVIDICDGSKNKIYATVEKNNFISTKKTNPVNSIFSTCHVQLISCPSCIIFLKIWLFDMQKSVCDRDKNVTDEAMCNCDLIEIVEITESLNKAYSRKRFCAKPNLSKNITFPFTYRSQIRSIAVVFTYTQEYEHPFTVEYTAKYNIHHIEVPTNMNDSNSFEGTVSTPFFPIQYPVDFRSQFNIRCSPKLREICRIKLVFTDHQLAPSSILEFFEGRKRKIGVTTGRIFRPPIIVSHGSILSINFYANRASSFGFKANYSVVLGNLEETLFKPKTTCGGYVEDIGGTIIMAHMTNDENVMYDCIWLIKPLLKVSSNLKTHLYIKVVTFLNMGYNAKLEIHGGFTSGHRLLQRILQKSTNWTYAENEEHTTNINSGLYVSLRGSFGTESRMAFSYSAFSYSHSHELGTGSTSTQTNQDCYVATDFLCNNRRCVNNNLHCDGFDHCGDNSDELQCSHENERENVRTFTQNYYFPLDDSPPSLPVGFFIAFCTSFVTFMLCSLFCSIVYRTKRQYDLNNRLQAISELLVEQHSQERFPPENGLVEDPPPEYDFPPNYHEVIVHNTIKKVILDSKNVQNSAIQTDMNETTNGCSSSGPYLYSAIESNQLKHEDTSSEGIHPSFYYPS